MHRRAIIFSTALMFHLSKLECLPHSANSRTCKQEHTSGRCLYSAK